MTAHLPTTTYGCSPASLGDGLYLVGLNPTYAGKKLPDQQRYCPGLTPTCAGKTLPDKA